jgi:hypothetical protein
MPSSSQADRRLEPGARTDDSAGGLFSDATSSPFELPPPPWQMPVEPGTGLLRWGGFGTPDRFDDLFNLGSFTAVGDMGTFPFDTLFMTE